MSRGGFFDKKSSATKYSEKIDNIFDEQCSKYGIPYVPAIMDPVDTIVAFGDIHGDYDLAVDMLESAKLVKYNKDDQDYDWVGGNTYVVQVGDQVDRCRPLPNGPKCMERGATENDEDSDVKILELFNRLDKQARKDGGMVISLLGNHELLNATGYMHYVSYEGLKGFENYIDPNDPNKKFEDGMEARSHAFAPGNEYGKMLGCTRYPAVIVGSNIFVHAGIIDGLIRDLEIEGPRDMEEINAKLRLWLLGIVKEKKIEHIIDSQDRNSMFWTRVLGRIDPGVPLSSDVCQNNISQAMQVFNMSNGERFSMTIGHTPQSFMKSDDINSTCGGKVWRIDNGSSKAFDSFDSHYVNENTRTNSRRAQYLKIVNDSDFYVCDANKCTKQKLN